MRDIGFFGQKPNGAFIGEIAAPGVDLNTAGHRLFSTDVTLVQILFTAQIPFNAVVTSSTTNGPAGPITVYSVEGTATYYFPEVLTFEPEIDLTFFQNRDATPEYIYAVAGGSKTTNYRSYTDRVEITYLQAFNSLGSFESLSARINVLNIPWDGVAP
jgi:hypothetical protein